MADMLKNVKVSRLLGVTSSSSGDLTTASVVDMQDFEGCLFLSIFETSSTDNGHKILQDSSSGMGSGADLEGSKNLLDGTQTVAITDVYRPRERYLRPTIIRDTASSLGGVIAVQYGPRKAPIENDGTNIAAETHISPAEGTA